VSYPVVASLLLLLSLGLLWKGADIVVHAAARLAHRFGISDLVIGMTVVALGTSAPEVAVTLLAALSNQPDIALGNVVGSNVFNMGLILGATAALRACPISPLLVRRDAPILLGATILLLICVWDQELARWEGLTMELLFIGYVIYLFRRDERTLEDHDIPGGSATAWDGPRLLLGLCALIGGGYLLVESASSMARAVGVSEWAIAVTMEATCSTSSGSSGSP
jgi:cation:H+ antiporter